MSRWLLLSFASCLWILQSTDAGVVGVCSEIKTCAACTEAFTHIFSFREHCRWCIDSNACGSAIACPSGAATAQRDAFKCPRPAPTSKGHRYTDKLGRSLYSLSLAVKQEDPVNCLRNSRPDVRLIQRYEVECDQAGNTCAGMLAVSEEAKAIYVVYRGSNFDKQLFQEFVQGIGAQLGAWEKFVNGTGVMTYFYGGFQKLFIDAGMKDKLFELVKKYPNYRVWTTGFSLGGSLASMTALYLANSTQVNSDRLRLVTFGEPRTGNYLYAKAIEQKIQFRYRIVNKNDIVTNVPASMDPDNLFLTVATAERQPYFYRHLIHYPEGMARTSKFKTCAYSEDGHCRNLGVALDVMDHGRYFDIKADDYLQSGCQRKLLLR